MRIHFENQSSVTYLIKVISGCGNSTCTKDADNAIYIAQKMKFSIKDFFSKCDQIRSFWSHLLKKSLMENFIFCAVISTEFPNIPKDNGVNKGKKS